VQLRKHLGIGLDRDDVVPETGEDAREDPRTGAEVGDTAALVAEHPAGCVGRVRRPDRVVQIRRRPERKAALVEGRLRLHTPRL